MSTATIDPPLDQLPQRVRRAALAELTPAGREGRAVGRARVYYTHPPDRNNAPQALDIGNFRAPTMDVLQALLTGLRRL